jgi:hypothetical protein
MVCFLLGEGSLQNEEDAGLCKQQVDMTNTHFFSCCSEKKVKTKETESDKERPRVWHKYLWRGMMITYSRRLAVDKFTKWQDISNWQQAYVTEFINPIRSNHRPKYGVTASIMRNFIHFVVPDHRNIRSTLESPKFVIILKHVRRILIFSPCIS